MLPPNEQLPTLEQMIEGWIRAMQMQKDTFDASEICRLCKAGQLTPAEMVKMTEFSGAIQAYQLAVDTAIAVGQS